MNRLKSFWQRMAALWRRECDVLKVGDRIVLNVPYNGRLHRKQATVETLTDWGAHVRCASAGTGSYRALYAEMESGVKVAPPPGDGYTGDVCSKCGGSRMRRCGTCAVCEECGETTGCG